MALTQFIKDLLYTSNKLIIPGFGSFVAQYSAARAEKENNIIYPPSRYFIFDDSPVEDDGLLEQYVSKKQQIPVEEARIAVKDMVDGFRKKLLDGGTLFIEEVGYFSLDTQKKVRFQKEESMDFNADNFGLFPLAYHTSANKPQTYGEIELPPVKRVSVSKILIIFLIVNAVGALSALVYWKFDNIKTYFGRFASKPPVTVPVKDTVQPVINPDTSKLGQTIDTLTNIKNALKYQEPVKEDTVAPVENSDAKYYIIAASFQSYHKAEIQANIMKKQGLHPEIIEFSQQLFRISVGEFATKEEALPQLEKFKVKKGTEGAWLLHR